MKMANDVIAIRASYTGTYFLAQCVVRICNLTLLEMRCISSIAALNLIVAALSCLFLALLKRSYHHQIPVRVPPRTRVVTAALQLTLFLIVTKSIAVNTYSVHRLSLLLSIPFCFLFSALVQHRFPRARAVLALALFCVGSLFVTTDSFTLSPQGVCLGFLYAIVNAALSLFIDHAMRQSGCEPIIFQESVAGFRLILSVAASAALVVVEPLETFALQIEIFPICLLVASAALDLATSVSMTSLIGSSSALTSLVVQQFCELMMILIGQSLNPTRFTTFKEAVLSFVGFSLAVPAQIVFLVIGDAPAKRPVDTEPFQMDETPALVPLDEM
jgi:hypothetical protein